MKPIYIPGDSIFTNSNDKGMFGRRNVVTIDVVNTHTKEIEQTVTSNLILYRGRNWLAQRAANISMTGRTTWKDMFISWLAIGTGGAVAGNPLTPVSPTLGDCDISTPGTIDSGLNYITVSDRQYHTIDDNYPVLVSDDDVDNDSVCSSDGTYTDPVSGETWNKDKFLILLYKVTIAADECNGDDSVGYQDINEAALYVSPSTSTSYSFTSTSIIPFAKTTFSTLRKQSDREFLISWMVYF